MLDEQLLLCGIFGRIIVKLVVYGVAFGLIAMACVVSKRFPRNVEVALCVLTMLFGVAAVVVAIVGDGRKVVVPNGVTFTVQRPGSTMIAECAPSLGLEASVPALVMGGVPLVFAMRRKRDDLEENSFAPSRNQKE